MSSLVQKIHKTNKTSRNVFDLSNNVQFSTVPGQLLPIRTDEVLPNDEFRFSFSSFARTVQMLVPSFARVKAHLDAFFVPYRLLGTDYQQIIVGDNRGAIGNYSGNNGAYTDKEPTFPCTDMHELLSAINNSNLSDSCGISYKLSSAVLANSLGYGISPVVKDSEVTYGKDAYPLSDGSLGSSVGAAPILSSDKNSTAREKMIVNLLPFQAYQKIYQDFYRNKLWEKENRASYYFGPSFDGVKLQGPTIEQNGLIEMRYHDYDKDRITGIIPDENSILSDGVSAYAQDIISGLREGVDSVYSLGNQQVPSQSKSEMGDNMSDLRAFTMDQSSFESILSSGGVDFSAVITRLSALSFRRLQAFQKFAEITDMSKSDYKHQIQAHFGFDVPSLNSDYSQYIGGMDLPLNISDVENTNGTQDLGYLGGKGVMTGGSRQFKFKASEHGIIMFILYVLPQVDYLNVYTDRSVLRFGRYDFAIPEFDSIGFEPVRAFDVCNSVVADADNYGDHNPYSVIGYLPRYWYYKTKVDSNFSFSFGNSSTSMVGTLNYNAYIVPFPTQYFLSCALTGVTYRGLKCLPYILNKLFPVTLDTNGDNAKEYVDTFPFIFTVYFNCSVMRSLSVDGLPY